MASALGILAAPGLLTMTAHAQAAAATAPRVQGTVKSISGNKVVVTPAGGGADITVTLADGARVQQSADLKTVTASSLDQVAVGDRVLATGTAGDATNFSATRLVMIKSDTLAQRDQKAQQDWARRGSGGIVTALDPASNTVTISSGAKKIAITTTGTTIYRRYAPGSVKFEEAKPGTLADVHVGDQLRVRGDKNPDGSAITADEIVSGSFKNLAGTVVSVDAAANTVVIKDLTSKKNETVAISAGSDLRAMPPEIAARFAPKGAGAAGGRGGYGGSGAAGGGAPGGGAPGGGAPGGGAPGGGAPGGGAPGGGAPGAGGAGGGAGRGPGGPGGAGGFGGRPGGGAPDLAQTITRLPKANLADIKSGQALMIVASGSSSPFTAITLLTGVEPLLTGPAGSELTIPPWSGAGGGGGGEGGGGGGPE
jgi:hypothetical protein